MTLSLLVVWAVSDFYVLFNTATSVDYLPEEDDEYLLGHTMTMIPFALLLPRIEASVISKWRSTAAKINDECMYADLTFSPPLLYASSTSMVYTFEGAAHRSCAACMGIVRKTPQSILRIVRVRYHGFLLSSFLEGRHRHASHPEFFQSTLSRLCKRR